MNWVKELLIREKEVKTYWLACGDLIIITNKDTYRGSCTVWSSTTTGRRCPTHRERWLCDIWTDRSQIREDNR